jgi:hypothetical protein
MSKSCREHLKSLQDSKAKLKSNATLEAMEAKHNDCLRLSKEKIDLASRAYDVVSLFFGSYFASNFVKYPTHTRAKRWNLEKKLGFLNLNNLEQIDSHIRRLDDYLSRFEVDLKEAGKGLQNEEIFFMSTPTAFLIQPSVFLSIQNRCRKD